MKNWIHARKREVLGPEVPVTDFSRWRMRDKVQNIGNSSTLEIRIANI